ncbi:MULTISPECIES: CsbD family protein [Pseudofrankia]|uniref:CsbD family protein n=1 Tax=Pseudofrankia TaxID=2994363 RepID=UPI000234D8EA|nr:MULTISPECIES: CsbD family protein [Pseudofrankia]OHV35024.1 general stress protein CsbD [Pseudofrankia sp. EUN1h]
MTMVDKMKNTLQRFTGRSKRTAGRVSGDPGLEARGAAEKAGGDVRQAGEHLKDATR